MSQPGGTDAALAEIWARAWALMARGVADRRHGFHLMQLATRDRDGAPAARTVVLRAVDAPRREVWFHTDARAAKVGEIMADPRVALVLWDPRGDLQLRLSGIAQAQVATAAARAAFAALPPASRAPYGRAITPGTAIAAPDPTPVAPDGGAPEAAPPTFAAVVVAISRLEWLQLGAEGHRRAAFQADDGWRGCWLAP